MVTNVKLVFPQYFLLYIKSRNNVKNGLVSLVLWLLLIMILLHFAIKTPSLFTYSDSPFLSSSVQSVRADKIVTNYFHIGNVDNLYIIINSSSYNQALQEIYSNLYLLNNATVITPNDYVSMLKTEYLSYLGLNEKNFSSTISQLYENLTRLKLYLISNFQYFEYQLNITFGLPLHNFTSNICPTYKENFDKVNGSLLEKARYAGYLTFKDPFLFYFGFNNYTNYTLALKFLIQFNNYTSLIERILKTQNITSVNESNVIFNNITTAFNSSFHKGTLWLFIINVPSNESLTNINQFTESLRNAYVIGHLAYYAQSAYYTQSNVEIIDITTIILVMILLILLVRSIVPILILISSAGTSLLLAYGLMYMETLLGYKIYYISGLVAPPIVFGLNIDYGILLIYRYFEEINKNNLDALLYALKNSIKGILLSGISITIGFSSFILSPSALLQNIGIALVTSSISALIPAVFFTYTLLLLIPQRYLSFPRRKLPSITDIRQRYLYKLSNFAVRHNKLLVILMLVSIVIFIFYFPSIHTNVNIDEILPPHANSLVGTKVLNQLYNYSIDYIILYGSPKANYTLIYNLTKTLIDQGNLVYGPMSLGSQIIVNNSNLYDHFHQGNYTLLIIYLKYPVFSNGAINLTNWLISKGFLVGGDNAQRIDIVNNTVSTYFSYTLPLTIILIVIYLFMILGSILLPLRLSLTVGLSSLLGAFTVALVYNSPYWLSPLVIFALLFSLGIDYDMFIIIRLFDEMKNDDDINSAIVRSVENTGLVVTTCGLILAGAFFSLMVANMRFLQEIGLGVGVSILFDTFVVRPILVPAIISILKKYNFWPFKARKFLYT
ncbi:MMPL family transporter [Saccharolobus islandicus]|uniref:Putative drug exporters of the RND superfamily n=1 Tax=Saccharolobus islandicus LAL14/1 TaxID=1241935 RepID=M9UA52_SACIS|nr:MMPL family transporter [Sulfolobus islandicus]AGJ62972.1 putative drug exporters of the RND superfamily [Sulfolobus islandicus LAL14/1]